MAENDTVFKDFDAARRERDQPPIEFKLGGQRFRCLPVMPAGPALDLVASPSADSYRDFIRAVLRDDDERQRPNGELIEASSLTRFDQLLYRRDDAVEVDQIVALADWIGTTYAGRPTEPSTDSSAGRRTGGPSLRITPAAAAKPSGT